MIAMEKEKDAFIENLTLLLEAGTGVKEALSTLGKDLRGRRLKEAVEKLEEYVSQGRPLWEGIEQTKMFPTYSVSLIRLGEESGQLPENLRIVSQQQRKQRNFRSKIQAAMIYPVFILGITLIIVGGVSWFILPQLSNAFAGLGADLPMMTQWVIALGDFLGSHGWWFVPAFLIIASVLLALIFIISPTKVIGQWIMMHTPLFRSLIRMVEVARMGYLWSTLMNAGISSVEALRSLEKATSYRMYQRFYRHLADRLDQGDPIQRVFTNYARTGFLIPYTVQGLISGGERSGRLPETLENIHQAYEEKVEIMSKNLSVILEPILLIVVWVIVVFLAAAIILPIYDMVGDVQTDRSVGVDPIPQFLASGIVDDIG